MNKAELGQVFTDSLIADYMVSLFDLDKTDCILDPCFGGGAFIDSLQRAGFTSITGCELDGDWFRLAQERMSNVILYHGDFLKYTPDVLYDGVIMNPPYIRQERIDDLSEFGITKETLHNNPVFQTLPKTANMYMYFVLKGLSLLKDNGQMVVIFPSSWMDARGAKSFKSFLYTDYFVEKQIHMHGQVFEGTALVDVVILKICKTTPLHKTEVISLIANNGVIEEAEIIQSDDKLGFSIPFKKYATVRRGITTGYNEAFINPNLCENASQYLRPIISSPKDICGYSTSNARADKLLVIPEGELPKELSEYITDVQNQIVLSKSPKTLYEKMLRGEKWYLLNPPKSKGIIFSYFVRNEMKFVMHEGEEIIRDNFYIIYPEIDPFLMFALLNNYYTYCQLEQSGKKYGAGLLKLQRYDIEGLLFSDIDSYPTDDLCLLIEKAKELATTGNADCIDVITEILSKQAPVPAEEIKNRFAEIKANRLEIK